MPARMEDQAKDLYDILGVSRAAKDIEIKRAFRTLVTREHPDKGGDPARFRTIQQAYEVLSDQKKRSEYDATGQVVKTVEEEFADSFAGGNFRDRGRMADAQKLPDLMEQIVVRQDPASQSHTAGFEAWLRSRGDTGVKVFTSDDVVNQFGVVKGSYDAIPLPKIKAYTVHCSRAGPPKEVLAVDSDPIPAELEWGQVLVSIRATPVGPADLYSVQTGGLYGGEAPTEPPFIPGHDGIGVVIKVGPGVKGLSDGDWVTPMVPNMGTWTSLMVAKEKDLMKLPSPEFMPLEQAALLREYVTAHRLLEEGGALKPGDCVVLNGAKGTVGQLIIQLCRLLRLRSVALISDVVDFEKTALWLKALGATEVLLDAGSIKAELDKLKFFSKPKLALDCIGGTSAARLADALGDAGELIVYGCMSGKSPQWTWHNWVFKGLKVRGFNTRRWMQSNRKKVGPLLESLAKLVNAGKLAAAVTEYELSTEFEEALDHAMDRGKNTKVLLKVTDVGEQYE